MRTRTPIVILTGWLFAISAVVAAPVEDQSSSTLNVTSTPISTSSSVAPSTVNASSSSAV
ncbi:hypothetical protein B0H11DRAFT_2219325 [Mycena galericulata]|nr:hypothetical protein B0H11DRAFT_2219325 [Mycena galericulata]